MSSSRKGLKPIPSSYITRWLTIWPFSTLKQVPVPLEGSHVKQLVSMLIMTIFFSYMIFDLNKPVNQEYGVMQKHG